METHEILEKQYKNLPAPLKHTITHSGWERTLGQIGERQGLSSEQRNDLEIETLLVLFALEPLSDYAKNIQQELKIEGELADNISSEVYDLIFNNIADQLEALYPENIENLEGEEVKIQEPSEQSIDQEKLVADLSKPETDIQIVNDVEEKKDQNILSKEDIVKEIENPIKTVEEKAVEVPKDKAEDSTPAEDRLQKIVTMPRTQEELQNQMKPIEEKGYKETDPYREPIK